LKIIEFVDHSDYYVWKNNLNSFIDNIYILF